MQYVFDFYQDGPQRPKYPERIFFGLLPSVETTVRVTEFRNWFICANGIQGNSLRPERFHISLLHVGDFKRLPSKFVYAAIQAAKAVSMEPLEVTFRFVESFESPPSRRHKRPLVLRGEGDGLFALHSILGTEMERNGLRAGRHFTPHMTLLYGPRLIPRQDIEPISVFIDEFALVHSKRGLGEYDIIDRWPLNLPITRREEAA